MKFLRLAALIVILTPAPASAFKSLGFSSGMTADQVRAAAPSGYGLRLNGDFGFIEKGSDLYATVTFCKGKLVSLSRTIDTQTEWFSLADKMTKQYGNPRVTSAANPWIAASAQAGVINGVEMSWRTGRTKYALTAYPARSGQAGAKTASSATVSVTDFGPANTCFAREKPVRHTATKASASKRGRKHALRQGGPHSLPQNGAYTVMSGVESSRMQASLGEASVRYTTRVRVEAPAPPPPPQPAHARTQDPVLRAFNFLKQRFGFGDRKTEQVASSGGRS